MDKDDLDYINQLKDELDYYKFENERFRKALEQITTSHIEAKNTQPHSTGHCGGCTSTAFKALKG